MASRGFKVTAVDLRSNPGKIHHPVVALNLMSKETVCFLSTLLSDGVVFYIHCDPPCGTASRDMLYENVAAICRHALAAHAYTSPLEIRNGR